MTTVKWHIYRRIGPTGISSHRLGKQTLEGVAAHPQWVRSKQWRWLPGQILAAAFIWKRGLSGFGERFHKKKKKVALTWFGSPCLQLCETNICVLWLQSDYHYEYTECDALGSRWRVAVPNKADICTGLPDPVHGTQCGRSTPTLWIVTLMCQIKWPLVVSFTRSPSVPSILL